MKTIHTDRAPAAVGPYSQAKVSGNFVFTSGQIPLDPVSGEVVGTEIVGQSEQVLKNLQAVLEAAGTDCSRVLKTTCFLTDMANFAAFNEVYAKYFPDRPARSCFAVAGLPKGALVEVEAVAEL